MDLSKQGEFGLIDGIRNGFRGVGNTDGVLGIGDDCAIIPQTDGMDTLVSTDMLVEGAHFLLDDVSAWQLGWKSAAVNISDIAAMGGKPIATFLSFALPKTLPQGWKEEFMDGYKAISERYGVALLGGDTTSSPSALCINVAVLGTCAHGTAKLRSAARPGQLICVTGTLGDSGAGLKTILEKRPRNPYLISRHYEPTPRVEEGLELARTAGVGAMMDISDGIGMDLRHILEESGVSAEIDPGKLPLSRELLDACSAYGWDPVELATGGGEDYELLFTVDPEDEATLSVQHTVIGRITEGGDHSIRWIGTDRDYLGFRHF